MIQIESQEYYTDIEGKKGFHIAFFCGSKLVAVQTVWEIIAPKNGKQMGAFLGIDWYGGEDES